MRKNPNLFSAHERRVALLVLLAAGVLTLGIMALARTDDRYSVSAASKKTEHAAARPKEPRCSSRAARSFNAAHKHNATARPKKPRQRRLRQMKDQ